jgi:hypothetical protein
LAVGCRAEEVACYQPGAQEAFCQLAAAELSGNDQIKIMIAVYHKEHAPYLLRGIDVRAAHPEATEAEIAKLEAEYKGWAHLVYAMMVAETLGEHLPAIGTYTFCPD